MAEQTETPEVTSGALTAETDVPPPTAEEMATWKGYRLDEMNGSGVGKVEGVYVDEPSGQPVWLLARMGRFGHYTLVPARDAVAGAGRVWVPYARELIRKAPRIEPGSTVSCKRERELLEHYGVGSPAAGRGAELAERPEDAITARPAS
ncbi:MAG TPA: PRC-barrel domain-containing protein [Solirubrobacterales bacterium]|jgi:hypothetical protein